MANIEEIIKKESIGTDRFSGSVAAELRVGSITIPLNLYFEIYAIFKFYANKKANSKAVFI